MEDDAILRMSIAQVLEAGPFEVTEAKCAMEGIEALTLESFHVVITDFHIPNGDGTTIAIRAFPTPVIMMTADPSNIPLLAAAQVSTAGFLKKPFKSDELVARMTTALMQRDPAKIRRWLSLYRR